MDKLDRAIANFEDETIDMTLGERVGELRNALMWNAFAAMKKIKKYGAKSPISEEEDYKQVESMKWFREIEKMYFSELKLNKALGKTQDQAVAANDFIKQIKEMKSCIGDIVQTTQ